MWTRSHPHDITAVPTMYLMMQYAVLQFEMSAGKWAKERKWLRCVWYANSMQLTLFSSRFFFVRLLCNLSRTFNRFIFHQCCQHRFFFFIFLFLFVFICAMWSPLFMLLFRLNNWLWKWILFFYYLHLYFFLTFIIHRHRHYFAKFAKKFGEQDSDR